MSFRAHLILCLVVLLLTIGLTSQAFGAPIPELRIRMGDTISDTSDTQRMLEVYIDTYEDPIAGFSIWVVLDEPKMSFDLKPVWSYDTTYWKCLEWEGPDCQDSAIVPADSVWDFYHVDSLQTSVITPDTLGCLTGGWEYLEMRSWGGTGQDVKIVGLADLPGGSQTPGIDPYVSGTLARVPFTAADLPDTTSDCLVHASVLTENGSQFCFSTPWGECLGWVDDTLWDTTFYRCTVWYLDSCLNWAVVPPGEPYDTLYVNTTVQSVLDSGLCIIEEYDIQVCESQQFLLGDFGCDGVLDISDLVALVTYMFSGGPPSNCPWNMDCDDDQEITIADLVCIVDYMFGSP